ncbi:MAG: lipopolysaccharide kinase InaA family protein, partial [Planctomycetota bacterium]
DMHVGNVMIQPDAPPGERMFVLDLHRVRIGRIRRKDVVRMLVYLADSTGKRGVGGRTRIRFLRRVVEQWKGEGYLTKKRLRRWNRRVRKAWTKHHRDHVRSRTKRCLVDSSEFTPDVSPHFKVYRRRDFPLSRALELTREHDRALDGLSSSCEIIKDGSRTAVTCCEEATGGRIFVKAFCRKTITERFKDIIRWRSRARTAWVAHRAFRVRDVPAVPALCVMEAKNTLSGRPDYLITRDPGIMADLEVVAKAQAADHPLHDDLNLSAEKRRQIAAAVAGLFRRMADSRVRHRDMKPSNILVKEGEEGGFDLWLVDMDRAVVEVDWTRRLWIYHLAQCNAGLDRGIGLLDRMRCLREIGRGRWTAQQRLSIARKVLDLSLDRDPMWLRDPQYPR